MQRSLNLLPEEGEAPEANWTLAGPGWMRPEKILLLNFGYQFDLDENILGQSGDLNGGPRGRCGPRRPKIRAIHQIHGCKVVEILQQDLRLYGLLPA